MSYATYTIRVGDRLGQTTLSAFPELRCEVRGAETVLTGDVADASALYGIVARLEALGLELVDIRRLETARDAAATADAIEPCPSPGADIAPDGPVT